MLDKLIYSLEISSKIFVISNRNFRYLGLIVFYGYFIHIFFILSNCLSYKTSEYLLLFIVFVWYNFQYIYFCDFPKDYRISIIC